MKHSSRGPTICPNCNTTPVEDSSGIHCKCPGQKWSYPYPVLAQAEFAALLKQKGFALTGNDTYYYFKGATITLWSDGDWYLDDLSVVKKPETPEEYLLTLPDFTVEN